MPSASGISHIWIESVCWAAGKARKGPNGTLPAPVGECLRDPNPLSEVAAALTTRYRADADAPILLRPDYGLHLTESLGLAGRLPEQRTDD